MTSYGCHTFEPDDQLNEEDSDLIAKPLIKDPNQNLALSWSLESSEHPTRDPGADQIISTRDTGPVGIIRSDEAFVGNAAHGGLPEPIRFTAITPT